VGTSGHPAQPKNPLLGKTEEIADMNGKSEKLERKKYTYISAVIIAAAAIAACSEKNKESPQRDVVSFTCTTSKLSVGKFVKDRGFVTTENPSVQVTLSVTTEIPRGDHDEGKATLHSDKSLIVAKTSLHNGNLWISTDIPVDHGGYVDAYIERNGHFRWTPEPYKYYSGTCIKAQNLF
jgi:hypothetical protein